MADPTPLADVNDIQLAFGRALTDSETARYPGILAKASALFRLEAEQDFTPGRSTVRRKVVGGDAYLPQRPVTAVHSVVDDDGRAVEFRLDGQWLRTSLQSNDFVHVDYSHGSVDVPVLVRSTIAEVVKKVMMIDPRAATGVNQYARTAARYSESMAYAGWAQGGSTTLAPDDRAIARSFRFRPPMIHVLRS